MTVANGCPRTGARKREVRAIDASCSTGMLGVVTTEPPVLEETPKRFRLSAICWIGWAVGSALLVLRGFLRNHSPGAFEVGEMTGQVVAMLLMSTLVAWLVWRLGGRSEPAGRIAFLVIMATGVAGQLVKPRELSAEGQAKLQEVDDLAKRNREELRQTLDSGKGVTVEQQVKATDRLVNSFKDMAQSSNSADRDIGLAMQAFGARLQEIQKQYVAASQGLQADNFFDLDGLATKEARDSRRSAIQDFKDANIQMRSLATDGAKWLEADMKQQQLSAKDIREAVAGYESQWTARRPVLLQIRDIDDKIAQVLADFIDLAEALEGRWSKEAGTGKLLLPTDDDVTKYNALLKAATDLHTEQVGLQKKLLAR